MVKKTFGYVSRSSGLAKTILKGTVKGKRGRRRQKDGWEDNIKEWPGMDIASSARADKKNKWGSDCCEATCVVCLWDRIE